ncbi:MAG: dTDP-4-dehydrorhamnose reductase [Bacteroidetes bacterium]|nr:dTDP-4-dehydrorhamnose reductase [Bacteroidota bacterium]
MSTKILITGSNGQLGQELKKIASGFREFECVFLSKEDLPIQHAETVNRYFLSAQPDYCINCAAYTAVDKAESEKQIAFLINADAVGVLASACGLRGTKLIHISTDYVFDGNSSTPLREEDITNPINTYGESKLRGEMLAMQNNPQTIIIRTAWVYSAFGNNFVKTMIKLMRDKESINVVSDQIGSPTYAEGLAKTIMKIIKDGKFIPGIYNYSDEGRISWYEFAVAIKELTGSNCKVNPIPTSQYPTPAKRPHYSLLDKSKIKATFNAEIHDWKSNLKSCLDEIKK